MESFAYDGRGDRVRQTDFNGGVWGFGFDAFGYPASQSNPLGQVARSLYDARGRLQSETDANGHSTTHSYDASDRRTASTLAGVGGGTRRTAYADAGRIQTATDEVGKVTVSTFDPLGRLLSVTNALGDARSLQYDRNGNKVSETNFRGNLTRFEYDNANRLVETTAPLGKVTTLTVDALGHVLSETVAGPNSATRRTEYSYDHPLYFRTETRQLGGAGGTRTTRVEPDNAGNPVSTTDPLGRVTTRAFDAFDRVTRIEEPSRTTELTYDPNGNKVTETVSGPDSPARTRRFAYDAANRNTTSTDGSGAVSHSSYFPNGEVESRIDARGGTVRFTLDAANRVIETRGPRADQVTTAGYDGVGNRIRERLANGRELIHQYDALHRLQSSRDPLGEILRRTYDADGNLTRETDALGATTTYTVNALNQRLAAALPEGRSQSWTYSVHDEVLTETSPTNALTTHSYDALGQRIGTVLPTGAGASQPRSWTYDLAGNVKTQTDSNGVVASFDYDAQNRRIRAQIDANDGGQAETWTYDARDNALTHTDRAGIAEAFRYDGEDRRLTRSRAGSLRETNSYDPNGNLASQRDANGHTTVFQYDAANQRTERRAPGAGGATETETWTYTASNQIATHTDAEGSRSTFSYDARDRVLTEKNGENETRSYSYDPNGNRTEIVLPNGAAWAQSFDQANRLVMVTSPEGHATRYGYHPDDQLASITDGNGHAVTLTSDALVRITERVYPGGIAFATEYDGEGNAIQDTRPDSAIARQFDALNRVKTASYTAIGGNNASIHTNYDPNGNPTSQVLDQDSRTLSTQRSYDSQNRLEREETVAPADAGAQFPAIAQQYTHTQRYTLDSNGNRTTTTDAANTTTQQSFDAQNRLTVSTTAGEGSTSNHWNKDGTLASIDHSVAPAVIPANAGTQLKTAARSATPSAQPTTNQTRYTYDRAKRITDITHTQNGATTLSFTYSYDQNGNRTQEVRTQSAINGQPGSIQTTTYAYDRDDRLIQTQVTRQPTDPSTPDERTDWTLDAVGNRITEVVTRSIDNVVTSNKTYAYSDRDQLLSMTDSANQLTVEYTYDQNGNRTSRTVTKQGQPSETISYSFDARDRMISAQPNAPNPGNAATIGYTYDADGRRIERFETPANGAAALATLYLYNGSTLQHEATPDATANTANATGLRLTDTYRTSAKLDRHIAFDLAGTPTIRLYQLDALDSPVALTDATGNTVTRTTYNAWGEIDQQTANGITQTPWQLPNYNPDQTGQAALLSGDGQTIGFTGAYEKDQTTGLYYANARWYDPLVGSFNAMDPAAGITNTPITFNTYLYAMANPTIHVDRDGRCEIGFCGFAFGVAYAPTDEQKAQYAKSYLNTSPGVGRSAGVAIEVGQTIAAPIQLVLDGTNAVAGDAAAQSRVGARVDAFAGQISANIALNAKLSLLGSNGPGLAAGIQFAGNVIDHVRELNAAIDNNDFVAQGRAGAKLTADTAQVLSIAFAADSLAGRAGAGLEGGNFGSNAHGAGSSSAAPMVVTEFDGGGVGVQLSQSPIVNPGRRVGLQFLSNGERFRDLSTGRFVAANEVTAADLARGFQGSGNFLGVDKFANKSLNPGQRLVGGLPGTSGFLTTESGLARSGNDATSLFRGIQVGPRTDKLTGVTSFRNLAGIFEVVDGQKAAVGITRANPAFGEGGLPQVFLPEVQLEIARVKRAAEILGRVATDEEIFAVLQQKSIIRKVDQVKLNNFVVDKPQ